MVEKAREVTAKLDFLSANQNDNETAKLIARRKIMTRVGTIFQCQSRLDHDGSRQVRSNLEQIVDSSTLSRHDLFDYVKKLQKEAAQDLYSTLADDSIGPLPY